MRPLLVGEDNPYSRDPRYALYPEPAHSAGGRLCRLIMGLSVKDYIRGFKRVNLCAGEWSMREARESALTIRKMSTSAVVLLGAKVCAAFDWEYKPFTDTDSSGYFVAEHVIVLPHPSGRNRAWNDSDAFDRANIVLRGAGVLPLPPWPPEEYPRKATGEWLELLHSTDTTVLRPAWCSNCHVIVKNEHCPECGPQSL